MHKAKERNFLTTKIKKMNAKEYSDQFPFDGDVQSGFVIMSETDLIQVMEEYANHYHQTQVKNNVALGSVSKCQHPYKKVISGDDGMWCTECNKYITTF